MTVPSIDQLKPSGGWRNPGVIRIPPIDIANAGVGQRIFLASVRRFGKLDAGNLWLMLMHNFRLLRGFLSFVPLMMPYGELDRLDTELVILRVGWNCRCRYEWGQHVDIGMRAGLSVDDIMRIPFGPDAPGWSARQVAILKATDDIHNERMVSESTWALLAGFFNPRLLLELLMLIGLYEGLAGVLNSTGLPLDPSLEKLLRTEAPA